MDLRKCGLALSPVLAAAALALALVPSTVSTQSGDQKLSTPPVQNENANEQVLSETQAVTAEEQEAVRDSWPEEAKLEATPMAMPVASENVDTDNHLSQRAGQPSGPIVIATGGRNDNDIPRVYEIPQGSEVESLNGIEPQAGTFPFSYTRYRLFPNTNTMYGTYPYRTVGKLFFNIGAARFVCSASVVSSANFSVVWTAGHCVFSPGFGFHSDFLFVPARRRVGTVPVAPFGEWTALTAVTLNGWAAGLLEYDHGALVMNRDADQTIGDRVGFLGFMANAPRQQHWHLDSYPQAQHSPPSPNPQFDGEHHEICAATWATNDLPTGGAADPPTIGVGCDQTGGASGGPWIVDLNALPVSASGGTPVAFNLLNGNNSYRYTGGPPNTLRLYGPYFTTGAINLRNFAENVDVP